MNLEQVDEQWAAATYVLDRQRAWREKEDLRDCIRHTVHVAFWIGFSTGVLGCSLLWLIAWWLA